MKQMLSMVLVLMLVCTFAMTAVATNFQLSASADAIEVGQQVVVTVALQETLTHENHFRNCQGELYYDPDVLTYVSHTMGVGYEDFNNAHLKNRKRVQFSKTAMNSDGYESIPAGTVLTVVFQAKETTTKDALTATVELKMSVMPIGMDAVQTHDSVSIQIRTGQAEKEESSAGTTETVTMTETKDGIVITTNSDALLPVTVPVEGVTYGSVIVILNEDGTETVVANTKMTENGLLFACPNRVTIKVVNLAKSFGDSKGDNWYNNAVDYVSARGIMKGMGNGNAFVPNGVTTRAQVWTMLARLSGVDTDNGNKENWYDTARTWAMQNGISDGTDANGEITREQLVTMLYRFSDGRGVSKSIAGFQDANQVSSWAQTAMEWAYGMGVMHGNADGTIHPKGDTTRSQLAQFFMNFIQNT